MFAMPACSYKMSIQATILDSLLSFFFYSYKHIVLSTIHQNTFVTQLMKGPGFERSWRKLLTDIEETAPSTLMPSFASGGVRSCKRAANVEVRPDGTIEADIFPLIRNCVGVLSSSEIMALAFVDSHTEFLEDIWQLHANIMEFTFRYPSWRPSIAKARKSRARILEKLIVWHTNMEAVGPVADSIAESG
jgi:hypothetical protein